VRTKVLADVEAEKVKLTKDYSQLEKKVIKMQQSLTSNVK